MWLSVATMPKQVAYEVIIHDISKRQPCTVSWNETEQVEKDLKHVLCEKSGCYAMNVSLTATPDQVCALCSCWLSSTYRYLYGHSNQTMVTLLTQTIHSCFKLLTSEALKFLGHLSEL